MKNWVAATLIGASFSLGILVSQITPRLVAQNITDMPQQDPLPDNNICKCGPDCSCADEDEFKKKR